MNFVKGLIIALFIVGMLMCIYFMASQELTGRESSLMAIILTIFSILATWLVGHLYSQSQHKKAIHEVQEFERNNLQTYAKKAAEKVNNLSNELGRLSLYLAEELERSDADDTKEALLSREERIASAVHIVNMLKSVNDTALSDWEGVIGDLLDQQREEKEETEEELRGVVERLQELLIAQFDERYGEYYDGTRMGQEIQSIRKDLRFIAMNLGMTQVPTRKKTRASKRDVQLHCPQCDGPINYRQRASSRGYKGITCKACGTKYISRHRPEEGFVLEERRVAVEKGTCPNCENEIRVELDTLPCSSTEIACEECDEQIRVSRMIEGTISVKAKQKKERSTTPVVKLTDAIIEQVRKTLPAQPWPKGIHRSIARELSLPSSTVKRAIGQLIRRGIFRPQIDGQVFVPAPSRIESVKGRESQKASRLKQGEDIVAEGESQSSAESST